MPAIAAAATCAAGTVRRATRSVARLYDAHLASAGLTTTQFSLLVSLERHKDLMLLSELAEEQVFERTSLYLRRAACVALRRRVPIGRSPRMRFSTESVVPRGAAS